MGKTVSIILIIAGAIILYLFFAKIAAKSTYDQSINACRLSVLAQSSSEVVPTFGGLDSPFSLNCDKRYVTFYNTKVELGLNPENMKPIPVLYNTRKTTKFRSLTDSTVNQVIAEEMRICKYQFADGKINIFSNNDAWLGQEICFICSEINFNDIEKKEFTTFLEYTKNAKFDGKTTYYDYLTENTIYANGKEETQSTENVDLSNYNMWDQPKYQLILRTMEEQSPNQDYLNSSEYLALKAQYDLTIDTSKKYFIITKKYDSVAIEYIHLSIIDSERISQFCDIQAS